MKIENWELKIMFQIHAFDGLAQNLTREYNKHINQ